MTPYPTSVTLFIPCLIDRLYPEVGEAVVAIFRNLGIKIDYPENQTCCGQPAYNSGYKREAATAARHFIRVFEPAEAIVCPSGSCVHMVRHHYPELFKNNAGWRNRAEKIGEKTFELTEFLVDILDVADLGARFSGRVTYHDSCHLLRGLGVREQPRKLIRAVAGAEFVEMAESDRCCGFGGGFSVKYPEISGALVADKVKHIMDVLPDAVVGADMGCLMNIQGRLSRMGSSIRTLHIAQLLAG